MGDSDSKKFGDKFLDKLGGQLNKTAPVYGKSLFTGAGTATKNAWDAGTDLSKSLIASNGFATGQKAALDSLGGVAKGYGAIANDGLTAEQRNAMSGLTDLGAEYDELGRAYDPNSDAYQTLRSNLSDKTLTDVASLFASNGRYGSDIMSESAAEGLGTALAGLDYSNMQNDVNNRYRSADSRAGVLGNLFTMGQTEIGNELAGLSGQAGTAGQQFGMGQTALGNEQAAVDAWSQIGAAKDADTQGKRLGDADLYDRKKNAELDWLSKIGATFGGQGAATGAANEAPWWQQILGYIAGNAGNALSSGAVR